MEKSGLYKFENLTISDSPIGGKVSTKMVVICHRVPKGAPSLNISNMKNEDSFDSRIYVGFTRYA